MKKIILPFKIGLITMVGYGQNTYNFENVTTEFIGSEKYFETFVIIDLMFKPDSIITIDDLQKVDKLFNRKFKGKFIYSDNSINNLYPLNTDMMWLNESSSFQFRYMIAESKSIYKTIHLIGSDDGFRILMTGEDNEKRTIIFHEKEKVFQSITLFNLVDLISFG